MASDVYKHIRELELSDLPDKEKQEKIRLAKGMLTKAQGWARRCGKSESIFVRKGGFDVRNGKWISRME